MIFSGLKILRGSNIQPVTVAGAAPNTYMITTGKISGTITPDPASFIKQCTQGLVPAPLDFLDTGTTQIKLYLTPMPMETFTSEWLYQALHLLIPRLVLAKYLGIKAKA